VEKIKKKRTDKNTARKGDEKEENHGKTKQECNLKNCIKTFYFSAYHFELNSPTHSTKVYLSTQQFVLVGQK